MDRLYGHYHPANGFDISMPVPYGYRRVTSTYPCPICGKPDWCLIGDDGLTVLCQRVSADRRVGEAGWLHKAESGTFNAPKHVPDRTYLDPNEVYDLAMRNAECGVDKLPGLAHSLGVSVESLADLLVGWDPDKDAWSFPMWDVDGEGVLNTTGIRYRDGDKKFSLTGGREGVFVPNSLINIAQQSVLYLTEGPSDTAAFLSAGSLAIGRPSNLGGASPILSILSNIPDPRYVIIVADNDDAGVEGALYLVNRFQRYIDSRGMHVLVIRPQGGMKDARQVYQTAGRDLSDHQYWQMVPEGSTPYVDRF